MFSLRPPSTNRPGFTLLELMIVSAVFAVVTLTATTVFTNVQSQQRQVQGRQRVVADGRYILESMARAARLGTVDYSYYQSPFCPTDNNSADCDLSVAGNAMHVLAVVDQVGTQSCYRLNAQRLEVSSNCGSGSATWTSVTSGDLKVTNFRVIVSPISNPYAAAPTSNLDCPGGTFDSGNGVCTCNFGTAGDPGNTPLPTACQKGQTCTETSLGSKSFICQAANIQPTVTLFLGTANANTASGEQSSSLMQTSVVSRIYRR